MRICSSFNLGAGREWSQVYGNGSLENLDSPFVEPPGSMRLVARDDMSTIVEKSFAPSLDVCGGTNLTLTISAPSQMNLSSVHSLTVMLIGGPDLTYHSSYSLHHLVRELYLLQPRQWMRVNVSARTFQTTEAFDCRRVSRIRIALNAIPSRQDTLDLGQLGFYRSPLARAVLLITEDDQWANFDVHGLPVLARHGLSGTIYANCGETGGSKMTLERLKILQDSGGWTIANHMWKHDSITRLSDDSAAHAIRRNAEHLRDLGFTGHRHFAYPFGIADRAKDSIVRTLCASARLTLGWPEGEAVPFSDPYRLRVIGFLGANIPLEPAKAVITRLVENGTVGMLGVHEIVPDGPLDTRKWLKSDWEALIEHVAGFVRQGRLDVLSLEEFERRYPSAFR